MAAASHVIGTFDDISQSEHDYLSYRSDNLASRKETEMDRNAMAVAVIRKKKQVKVNKVASVHVKNGTASTILHRNKSVSL